MYSAGLTYPSTFQPIQIPRRHPPPLAQRERSTSAPNVCYNMVGNQGGIDTALEDWSYRIKAHNIAATGTLSYPFTILHEFQFKYRLCKMKWLSIGYYVSLTFIDNFLFSFFFINQIKCTKFHFFGVVCSFCFLFFPFACCNFLLNHTKKNPENKPKPFKIRCVWGNPACTQNHRNPTIKSSKKKKQKKQNTTQKLA